MRKVVLIARREFFSAVGNRAFLIGLLMMPLFFAVLIALGPFLFSPRSVEVRGQVAVIDPTGEVAPGIRESLDSTALADRRRRQAQQILEQAPEAARQASRSNEVVVQNLLVGAPVEVEVVERPGSADVEKEKAWLLGSTPEQRRLGVIRVHEDAVHPPVGGAPGAYDLYLPAGTSDRLETLLHDGVREAIVDARLRAEQLDRERIEAMMDVRRVRSVTVTRGTARPTVSGFNLLLPLALAGLIMMGVVVGGQSLLTSTIEEKSNRVIEVLLSAVSPMQLMAGKILGQLAVSLLVLVIYTSLGLLLLVSSAMLGLFNPWLLAYLAAFFLVTYVMFAAVFAAAGAAVTDIKEGQALMGPLMLVLIAPWMLAFPITRNPDSTVAVALSFLPPVNSFVMMLRLASGQPPPAWQALLSLGIGAAAAWGAIWCAAKIFRIGLLMHGKPPNVATLLRWARQA